MTGFRLYIFCFFLVVGHGVSRADNLTDSILSVSRLANKYFMDKWPDPGIDIVTDKVRPSHIWTRSVYYEGLMGLYSIDSLQTYIDYTDSWADSHQWSPRSTIWRIHADDQCCTQTYMTRYFQAGGAEKYLASKADFDNQMNGKDRSTHYKDWTWIDAIQMAMPALAMLYKITGERKYIDFAMQSYLWSRNAGVENKGVGFFVENEGLWWRDAKLYGIKESDGKNSYWSRGNGWVYAALVRVLEQLSPDDEYYAQLKHDFLLMSEAIIPIQRSDGFWNASLVSTQYNGPELSGTGLFLYGLAWGVRNGFLTDAKYRAAADKAWQACKSCVHDNGFLGYVQGTSDRPSKGWPFEYDAEPNFEDYGLGCFLLGTTEYYKLVKAQPADDTTGVTTLSFPSRRADDAIYDISGRRIHNIYKKGVYIRNGKKYLH